METEDHRLYPSKHISNKSMEVVNSLDVSAQLVEDLKFMQASNVNVFNCLSHSVKLSSQYNYHIWKAQMLCLMESQLMHGIIDAKFDRPEAKSIKIIKQYDSLLKGWIYGSLNEEVLKNVVGCEYARDVWAKLESFYDPKIGSAPPEEHIERKNSDGHTALNIAAIFDNKCAAELLLSTYVFLLEVSEADSVHLPLSHYSDSYVQIGVNFLITAIFTKQYDLVSTLINIYPELVRRDDQVLMAIAISFPPKLSFREAFIYPLGDTATHILQLGTMLVLVDRFSHYISGPIGVLYPIYQLIRLFTLHFSASFPLLCAVFPNVEVSCNSAPIKNVENKQKEYKQAKRILNCICDEIDALCSTDTSHPYYSGPIFEAVRQDAYKLAVINRSEKVYNLFYPIIKLTESYSTMTDSSMNNLVRLAGRLAPSYVLSRTAGAALLLQRELQWREEVEKLMLPIDLLKENIYMETPEILLNSCFNIFPHLS
nr:hypothetical protein [Tanacetum cinerariifolium]